MKKLTLAVAITCSTCAAMAFAHPVGATFETRGGCEAALAQINNADRERLVDLGVFDKPGDANEFFHETFDCEKVGDIWVLVRR